MALFNFDKEKLDKQKEELNDLKNKQDVNQRLAEVNKTYTGRPSQL